jgi:hypothetical protein
MKVFFMNKILTITALLFLSTGLHSSALDLSPLATQALERAKQIAILCTTLNQPNHEQGTDLRACKLEVMNHIYELTEINLPISSIRNYVSPYCAKSDILYFDSIIPHMHNYTTQRNQKRKSISALESSSKKPRTSPILQTPVNSKTQQAKLAMCNILHICKTLGKPKSETPEINRINCKQAIIKHIEALFLIGTSSKDIRHKLQKYCTETDLQYFDACLPYAHKQYSASPQTSYTPQEKIIHIASHCGAVNAWIKNGKQGIYKERIKESLDAVTSTTMELLSNKEMLFPQIKESIENFSVDGDLETFMSIMKTFKQKSKLKKQQRELEKQQDESSTPVAQIDQYIKDVLYS